MPLSIAWLNLVTPTHIDPSELTSRPATRLPMHLPLSSLPFPCHLCHLSLFGVCLLRYVVLLLEEISLHLGVLQKLKVAICEHSQRSLHDRLDLPTHAPLSCIFLVNIALEAGRHAQRGVPPRCNQHQELHYSTNLAESRTSPDGSLPPGSSTFPAPP